MISIPATTAFVACIREHSLKHGAFIFFRGRCSTPQAFNGVGTLSLEIVPHSRNVHEEGHGPRVDKGVRRTPLPHARPQRVAKVRGAKDADGVRDLLLVKGKGERDGVRRKVTLVIAIHVKDRCRGR